MRSTRFAFASAALAALASASRRPAYAQKPQCIRVPAGMASGFVNLEQSDQAGMHYVVVQNVVIGNRSPGVVSWRNNDFTFASGGKKYHPVSRPGLGAIDISQKTGVCGPGQAIRGNLVFLVPSSVDTGSVEFRPNNWYVNGMPLILCCSSTCR